MANRLTELAHFHVLLIEAGSALVLLPITCDYLNWSNLYIRDFDDLAIRVPGLASTLAHTQFVSLTI